MVPLRKYVVGPDGRGQNGLKLQFVAWSKVAASPVSNWWFRMVSLQTFCTVAILCVMSNPALNKPAPNYQKELPNMGGLFYTVVILIEL